jgi:hypothetical protein
MNWIFSYSDINLSKKVNFENVQDAIKNPNEYILLNTLPSENQNCLIKGTLHASREETVINEMISQSNVSDKKIIIYGKNTNDHTIEKKYKQLYGLGISGIYVYLGGLFEWLLLQDIYGINEFPTSTKQLDLLQFKSPKIML